MTDITQRIDIVLAGERRIDQVALNSIIEYIYISNMREDFINENVTDLSINIKTHLKTLLNNMGIHVKKHQDGLILMAIKASKSIAHMLYYSIQISMGNDNAKKDLDKILENIKKEDVIEFFLKIDSVTLSMMTGPIRIIDNLTGWNIWENIKDRMTDGKSKAKSVIMDVISIAHISNDKMVKSTAKEFINSVSTFFDVEGYKRI